MLVVGAGPGIAAATARRFGHEGWSVSLVARDAEAVAGLRDQLAAEGIDAASAAADAGDGAGLTAAIGTLVDTGGPVDALLHNVSVGREVAAADLTPDQLTADLAAGVVALQTAVRAVLPGMTERGSGTVLATGSSVADRPMASLPTLGAQKSALRALAVALAADLAPRGVHVATVTIRGLVGPGKKIEPDRVAALYADLVAETAGPREDWRTVVDLTS
nr:SDR family oxidoreductase [Geodermatophilus sabuli]